MSGKGSKRGRSQSFSGYPTQSSNTRITRRSRSRSPHETSTGRVKHIDTDEPCRVWAPDDKRLWCDGCVVTVESITSPRIKPEDCEHPFDDLDHPKHLDQKAYVADHKSKLRRSSFSGTVDARSALTPVKAKRQSLRRRSSSSSDSITPSKRPLSAPAGGNRAGAFRRLRFSSVASEKIDTAQASRNTCLVCRLESKQRQGDQGGQGN